MAEHTIPPNVVLNILRGERSPIRFEEFCCDLFTKVDGVDYLPTSRSYDLGRNGRSLPSGESGEVGFICCATGVEENFEDKAKGDLQKILKFAHPASIYFCSTQEKSEGYLQKVESQIRELAPDVKRVSALGAYQIVPLVSQRYPEVFERRYVAELLEHREWLKADDISNMELQTVGMQIALTTQFHEDAQSLRSELLQTSVLSSLADGRTRTIADIAKAVSDALRLPKNIQAEYFREVLIHLTEALLVSHTDGLYTITEEGRRHHAELLKVGRAHLTNGKDLIRQAVAALLGYDLGEEPFNRLWNRLRDEIANLFFANGLRLIRAIASLLATNEKSLPSKTFAELLGGVKDSIQSLGVGGARSEEVAQAILDLFSDRDSPAFNWLTELAVKYVTLCSLGLEPSAQQEVSGRLKDIDLILDTDIVLSLLSQGERPHRAVEEVLKRWRSIGGQVLIPPPVLEEAAYHAWISDYEFRDVENLLAHVQPEEVHRYAKTAFVRAFCVVAQGDFRLSSWTRFISEFRGASPTDSEKIAAILEEDYGLKIITDFALDRDFARTVSEMIYKIRKIAPSAYVPKQTGDKVARDGQIIAFLKHCRESKPRRYHTTVIISSSPVLQQAGAAFTGNLDEPAPVWPIGALAYLVSLIPGVRLTLSILKNCLFDEGEVEALDRLVRLALRVVRESKSYEIGYSRRPTLKRALAREIDKAAVQRSQRPAQLVDELLEGRSQDREVLAEVIANAVDEIAASTHEKELQELRRRLSQSDGPLP